MIHEARGTICSRPRIASFRRGIAAVCAAAAPGPFAAAAPVWKPAPQPPEPPDQTLGLRLDTEFTGPLETVAETMLFILNGYYGYVAAAVVLLVLCVLPRMRRNGDERNAESRAAT